MDIETGDHANQWQYEIPAMRMHACADISQFASEWLACPSTTVVEHFPDRIFKTMAGPRYCQVLQIWGEERSHVNTEGMLKFRSEGRKVLVGEFLLLLSLISMKLINSISKLDRRGIHG